MKTALPTTMTQFDFTNFPNFSEIVATYKVFYSIVRTIICQDFVAMPSRFFTITTLIVISIQIHSLGHVPLFKNYSFEKNPVFSDPCMYNPCPILSHFCVKPDSFLFHSLPNPCPHLSHSFAVLVPLQSQYYSTSIKLLPFLSHSSPILVPFLSHFNPTSVQLHSHCCPTPVPLLSHSCSTLSHASPTLSSPTPFHLQSHCSPNVSVILLSNSCSISVPFLSHSCFNKYGLLYKVSFLRRKGILTPNFKFCVYVCRIYWQQHSVNIAKKLPDNVKIS